MSNVYCIGPACDRPAFRGEYCEAHTKQLQRTGRVVPIAEKLSAEERAIEAGNAMLECEGDDDEFEDKRRAFLLASRTLGQKAMLEARRKGVEAARARGTHMGRPAKVPTEQLRRFFEATGSVAAVARVLEVIGMKMAISSIYERLFGKSDFPNAPKPSRPRKAG